MRSFIHRDQIAEKLEIARTIGIVTDYFVGPCPHAHRPDATVRVARSPNVSDEAVKDYLIRLLHGFVSDHQIVITAPFGLPDTAPELMTSGERASSLAMPVSAAA
jgi:hypothetical protein